MSDNPQSGADGLSAHKPDMGDSEDANLGYSEDLKAAAGLPIEAEIPAPPRASNWNDWPDSAVVSEVVEAATRSMLLQERRMDALLRRRRAAGWNARASGAAGSGASAPEGDKLHLFVWRQESAGTGEPPGRRPQSRQARGWGKPMQPPGEASPARQHSPSYCFLGEASPATASAGSQHPQAADDGPGLKQPRRWLEGEIE